MGEIFSEVFFGRICWEDFLGNFFLEDVFGRIFFEGNSSGGVFCLRWFVKILVFVKILSQLGRKEGRRARI